MLYLAYESFYFSYNFNYVYVNWVVRQKMKSWMQNEGNKVIGRKNIREKRVLVMVVVGMMILRE